MEYNFRKLEQEWQRNWKENKVYRVENDPSRPKYYVLDMFPYPSGAGLHVGHPLGYIASDIYSRFKRLKGFNVLHPMGFDSFGLPAEQYALETGQHPAKTTEENIATYRRQLDRIGFCYDWSREVRTSDPAYYKWTQWVFLRLFDSWYDRSAKKAARISELIAVFEKEGNAAHVCPGDRELHFSAAEWKSFSEQRQQEVLMHYRLAFSSYGEVNWCEGLGTVLANDEVVNGVSERGGFPVIKKKMRQWYLRITEYADRLLEGLERIDFSEPMKEMQRNWIGRSQGAEIDFELKGQEQKLKVYTTRPDTIFGVDFMVIAPEHELVKQITTPAQQEAVDKYLEYVKSRSDRERMAEVKQVTGCFTGAYAVNPFSGTEIPVYIAEYVLAGYGTGAIMAVPCGDQRDFDFARHFNIPITNIIGAHFNGGEANPTKEAELTNSGFLNGTPMKEAMDLVIARLEEMGIGKRQINYRMHDAGFSRQRYWGEPFPVLWKEGIAKPLDEKALPLELPHVDSYRPGPEGEGPLANLTDWVNTPEGRRETSTMPGYAGSSWYFLRYMDPENDQVFCDRAASDYWGQVDLYIGGTEHAVGHLLYSRLWTKVLCDLGYIGFDEPYKKLVNQGMIQGSSRFVYRLAWGLSKLAGFFGDLESLPLIFVSHDVAKQLDIGDSQFMNAFKVRIGEILSKIGNDKILEDLSGEYRYSRLHVNVDLVDGVELDIDRYREKTMGAEEAYFICDNLEIIRPGENGKDRKLTYTCGTEVEKMSKSKYNTVNPDELVDKYGADTFRMYEMFLGPVEASKPWDTKGIEGVHRFLKKLWRLFYDEVKGQVWNEDAPTEAEWKILHKTIKKVADDTERFSFNTAVSAFMVCVNELTEQKCHKKEILQPLLILLTPYAPHICEELWHLLGNTSSILDASYPQPEEKYLIESSKSYPVSINGKLRTNITISMEASQEEVEVLVLADEIVQKWMEGKPAKRVIYVRGKMVNVVV